MIIIEQIDRDQAQRVWQRVTGASPEHASVAELLALEEESVQHFRRFARRLPPAGASVFDTLARQAARRRSILLGILRLSAAPTGAAADPAPLPRNNEEVLKLLFAHKRKTIRLYDALARDPEQGSVFASLSRQTREELLPLLEQLGSAQK